MRLWEQSGASAFMVSALMAAVSLAAPARGPNIASPREHLLETARAVHSLPPAEAVHTYPVHLRATLTYYDPYIDPRRGAIFVVDASGCGFVSIPHRPILPIHPGDLIDIQGVTGPGDYASIVEAPDVHVVGKGNLPPNPEKLSMEDLFSGAHDCEWMQAEGQVRSVHLEADDVALEVDGGGRFFTAVSPREPGADYDALIGSEVRVTANTAPVFNSLRQMVGVHVFFPTLQQIQVIRAAPSEPFASPVTPISDLFRFSPDRESSQLSHRVHVEGTLTLNWPGRMICIQNGQDAVCANTRQKSEAALGSPVDVVGFPVIRMFKAMLEDATFRIGRGVSAPSPPVRITAKEAMNDALEGRLVTVDAELIGQDLTSAEPKLMLRDGDVLISANLPKEALGSAPHQWKEGSLLRVTGICNVDVDTWSISLGSGMVQSESARLLIRSIGDIAVLHAPSWWTPQHTLMSFVAVCALILIAFTWIFILRRVVAQRTRALRDSEERLRHLSQHDALTGLPNRVLLNDRLETELKRADRFSSWVALLLVDLDGFKAVNDEFGHHAGDELLRKLAGRLSECVRMTDTVARIGGDEFVILLPDLRSPAEAEYIAGKVISAAAAPFIIDGVFTAVTVSVGVVTYPEGGADPETLLRSADEAMYAAKKSGKNSFKMQRPRLAGQPAEQEAAPEEGSRLPLASSGR